MCRSTAIESFIRLIAAFVALPAKKLGFDPNMEMYDKATGIAMPSHKLSKPIEPQSLYDKQWVIRLNDATKYLTVKTLKISHAEIMCGTGLVVWVVVPYGIPPKTCRALHGSLPASNSSGDNLQVLGLLLSPSSLLNFFFFKVFVLKQSWRPVVRNNEGYSYNFAKGSDTDYIGVILSCEDAIIEDEKDETDHLIRQRLDATLQPRITTARKRTREWVRKFELDGWEVRPELYPSLQIYYTAREGIRGFSIKHPREVVSQIRTRLLSSTYGWSAVAKTL